MKLLFAALIGLSMVSSAFAGSYSCTSERGDTMSLHRASHQLSLSIRTDDGETFSCKLLARPAGSAAAIKGIYKGLPVRDPSCWVTGEACAMAWCKAIGGVVDPSTGGCENY